MDFLSFKCLVEDLRVVYHEDVGDVGDIPHFLGISSWGKPLPGVLEPFSKGDTNFDDDLIQEIKGYTETDEAEGVAHPQGTEGNLPPVIQSAHTRSSTSEGASTSSAQASTSGTRYVCRDWVSHISVKRLKLIARQFWLREESINLAQMRDRIFLILVWWLSARRSCNKELLFCFIISSLQCFNTSMLPPFSSPLIPSASWWRSSSPLWKWA